MTNAISIQNEINKAREIPIEKKENNEEEWRRQRAQ